MGRTINNLTNGKSRSVSLNRQRLAYAISKVATEEAFWQHYAECPLVKKADRLAALEAENAELRKKLEQAALSDI